MNNMERLNQQRVTLQELEIRVKNLEDRGAAIAQLRSCFEGLNQAVIDSLRVLDDQTTGLTAIASDLSQRLVKVEKFLFDQPVV